MTIKLTHVAKLIKNMDEVRKLLDIHTQLTGDGPGNRTSVNVLNKSGIVLAVACWEAFIEDIAELAFSKLLKSTDNPMVFSGKVRALASKEIRKSSDETKIWELAGTGWKKILKMHKKKVLNEYLGNFNTPKTKQINTLFENLIGFKTLSSNWKWKGMGNSQACSKLDALITLRGEIAHRVQSGKSVRKNDVIDSVDFIQNLAAITSNRVGSYIKSKTKKIPWMIVNYGNIR